MTFLLPSLATAWAASVGNDGGRTRCTNPGVFVQVYPTGLLCTWFEKIGKLYRSVREGTNLFWSISMSSRAAAMDVGKGSAIISYMFNDEPCALIRKGSPHNIWGHRKRGC